MFIEQLHTSDQLAGSIAKKPDFFLDNGEFLPVVD